MEQNKKIKILEVTAIDETIKCFLLPLIDRLSNEGFMVTACCSYGKNTDELRNKGYRIENIEIARKISFLSNIKSVVQLMRIIKKERFGVVHAHTPVAALLTRVAAKLSKVPLVIYTAHGFYFHERMSKTVYRLYFSIEKFMGRFMTDYIFAVSDEDRLTAIKGKIINKDSICTIANGIDVRKRFNPEKIDQEVITKKKRQLNINENDKVIIFIGRLVKEKGIIDLIDGFNRIRKDHCKLVLVGECFASERDTKTYEFIQNAAQENKNIILTGKRSDISDLLYLANVFILPSYREGLPVSVLEAMAMEKPIIATNIRGCREEVVDGKTGFLIEVGNPEQIKEKIITILESPELEENMGRESRLRVEQLFDEDKVIEKQYEVIKRLIQDKFKANSFS